MCQLNGIGHEMKLNRGGVCGYRVVIVDGNVMSSLYPHFKRASYGRSFYKIGKTYKATGSKGAIIASGHNNTGFHAFYTYAEALKQRPTTKGCSIVRCRMYGNATVYTNGLRAERMKIEAIVCGRRLK